MEVIGYIERVDLPGLELFALDAKIDTGADSCSMHCDDIEVEGEKVIFTLHDEVHPAYHGKRLTLPISKIKNVKSSNGSIEERVFVKSMLKLGCKTYEAEISLTNRENMKYPMLIGRRFLSHHYLIDVSHKYITKEK
ncbi:RimK/LysX family protein [Sulfurovum sp. TSL1]|uniref:ATP-dependent zinc protease family protein n=1 Tax=Sulfurovum sp. TSL1 TaxID=2826994 RepID=UPI001CC5890F|nr:RimK/LysX family protein [Sulfurovum sp. TSL1]GIT97364.1 ribosomal protein S6 modification protein [Sulfurovum sp. TSL1]